MIHPDTKLVEIDGAVGVGIVATTEIPKGTITWCRDELDMVLSRRQTKKLPSELRHEFLRYAYRNDSGNYVLNWDNGRYQNHSCDPTSCLIPHLDCEIAIRDIRPGEQLSADYATYNIANGFSCACGAENCRSRVTPKDNAFRLQELQPEISNALRQLDNVAQPLMPAFDALLACEANPAKSADRRRWRDKITAFWRSIMSENKTDPV